MLFHTTGHPQIDDIIRGVIGVFEAAFPGRVGACYLAGSYADGSAVPLSDIDIRIVFKGGFQGEAEIERFRHMRKCCGLISPVDIDLPPLSEDRLHHDEGWIHETIGIKLAGVPLYGEDIRDSLALRAEQMVIRKRDWLPLYKQYIADEWTAFLETLYTTCKQDWAYRVPDDEATHQILRGLCRKALAFENHYLTIYREYLLEHLRSDDPARQLFAMGRLKEVVYPDRGEGVTPKAKGKR